MLGQPQRSKFLTSVANKYTSAVIDVRCLRKGRGRMESVVLKPEKLDIGYDKKGDVLYISLGKPREADDSIEPQEGVVLRTIKVELVGITIVGLKGRFAVTSR